MFLSVLFVRDIQSYEKILGSYEIGIAFQFNVYKKVKIFPK